MTSDINSINIDQSFWRDDFDDRPVIVSISCITYNHEKYIRDALEGFVNQKTNFRFEAIVHDDASTDGTADIIREYAEKYPSIIKPIYETENQYSKRDGSLGRIMDAHMRGKYIAMCEGDDYWIDPLKLQKQVDFMETHPDYGMVHGVSRIFKESNSKYAKTFGSEFENIYDLLKFNHISTPTVLLRKTIYDFYIKDLEETKVHFLMGDYPLWLFFSYKTKIYFFNEIFSVYRVIENSASHSKNYKDQIKFIESYFEIRRFYIHKFNLVKCDFENDLIRKKFNCSVSFEDKDEANKYFMQLKSKNYKDYIKYILLYMGLGSFLKR